MKLGTKILIAATISLSLLGHGLLAQVKVRIEQSEEARGKIINGTLVNSVKGNVIMKQGDAIIYCDSAVFYETTNLVEAFGNVKIVDDSTVITAARGSYDGNTKMARLRSNVVFKQINGTTLYTDHLDYNRGTRQANYFNGGKLVDSTMVLTSKRGYYNELTRIASFGKDVKGENPDMTLASDTLQYSTQLKVVYFRGPTTLTDKKGKSAKYETGFYNTITRRSSLRSGEFETPNYFLQGMDIEIDDRRKYYTADGKVLMLSKDEDVVITGERAIYDKANRRIKIFGDALLKRVMAEGDTLYMRADTLLSIDSGKENDETLFAYRNVFLFKSDVQGRADSLVYVAKDSLMHMFNDPVLWTKGTQMTSDSMRMIIRNRTLEELVMRGNSFIISQDTFKLFNQIKGRSMVTHFAGNEIDRVDVNGNGESVYYVIDEQKMKLTGMNKVICSKMEIHFKNRSVDEIYFLVKPEGELIPPREVTRELAILPGFRWRIKEKPDLDKVLRRDEEVIDEEAER